MRFPKKGKAMKAEAVERDEEKKAEEIVKCSCCDRTLKNSSEAIRSRKSVMCVSCYESLLNPFPKCCSGGALI
jgi:hypothetical protein